MIRSKRVWKAKIQLSYITSQTQVLMVTVSARIYD